jgi:tRNA pseudouridine55 synthase
VDSFQAVNKLKYADKQQDFQKIQNWTCRNLRPISHRIIIVCTGNSQRELQNFKVRPKNTQALFFIGATTASYDLETEVDQTPTAHRWH